MVSGLAQRLLGTFPNRPAAIPPGFWPWARPDRSADLAPESAEVPFIDAANSRGNHFDALRLILALLVVFAHAYNLADGNCLREPGFRFMRGQLYTGDIAVCCFFMLSGYLITQSWERSRSALSFARKRLLRIGPGFVAAFVFSLFVVVPLESDRAYRIWQAPMLRTNLWHLIWLEQPVTPPTFATNPFPYVVNGSLWTIPYEARCYLAVAALGAAGCLRRRWLLSGLLVTLVAFWFALAFLPKPVLPPRVAWIVGLPEVWVRLAPCFLGGMIVYRLRERLVWHWLGAAIALVILVVACRTTPGLRLAIPTAGVYLFFYLAFHGGWSWPSASRYGDFSYGIYLFSCPIQQWIMARMPGLSPLGLMVWSFPPSIVAGLLSWFLVERHFLKHRLAARSVGRVALST